jgi:outer membrane protein OmpA-like peptidoglycan-associated protein
VKSNLEPNFDLLMKRNILNLIILLFILSSLTFYGCAVAVLGIGAAGAGAAYFNGKLTKTYESEYHDTVRASSTTMKELRIPITEIIADELRTEIKAKRPDDTPIAIEVVRIDQDHTQVSVRTGSVGVWDKRVSEQIHGYINQNLNRGPIDDKKSSENLARDNTQPTIGKVVQPEIEVVQPEIIEEDLDDNSVQETLYAESIVKLEDQTQTDTPLKSAELSTDSIFMIFFKQNSNDLSGKAVEKLDQVFEILIKNPYTEITLNGYSDSIGSASYNEMISEIRANAVKSYLVGKGIEPSRILSFGHGSQKFIASNKTAEGRQLNRRVEIEIINP